MRRALTEPDRIACANLFARAERCLDRADVAEKLRLPTPTLAADFEAGELSVESTPPRPCRSARPVGRRGRAWLRRAICRAAAWAPRDGRAALVHAVAHIEFNAINLAWDAVYRFRGMPARLLSRLDRRCRRRGAAFPPARKRDWHELGHAYGDFDAHDGLWEMAVKTSDSCLERMALVPRVLEARGLDVTPGMIERLRAVGDARHGARFSN